MHSFYAYIDESGDEGFTFKDYPERASSEWFVLSAVVLRGSNKDNASRGLLEVLRPIEEHRGTVCHFIKLPHEQRIPLIHRIAALPIHTVSICFNKKSLGNHSLAGDRRLYFYCARFLLERISWIVRDYRSLGTADRTCKLVFAHCKRLSYERLAEYFVSLRAKETQIAWDFVDHENLSVKATGNSIWLRAADAVASGTWRALELNEGGFCEDRYARMLKPVVYCRNKNYLSYGLKIFPQRPKVEEARDNRYGWLDLFDRAG